MKKTIGITLAIMIAASFLAGCREHMEENRAEEVKEPETETVQTDEWTENPDGTGEELQVNCSDAEEDLYEKFLNGERCVGDADIYYFITPTGEPDRRYAADYIIMDSTGDGIPELHLRTAREYTIFSYVDDELVIIQSFFSSPWLYNVTKNGAFIYREDTGTTLGNYYLYFEMDIYGNFFNEVTFEWTDINENFICDENDEFIFDNRPCTKEGWCEQTREYLFIDEEGRYQIRDQVEWIRYCE